MIGRDHRDRRVRRALSQLPTPEHRPRFWADLDDRLGAERQAGSRPGPRADLTVPGGWGPVADVETPAAPPPRRRPLALAAAALVVIVAAALVSVAGRDTHRVRVTGPPDGAPTTRVGASDGRSEAERAALGWVGAIAAGDMRTAWDELGPQARGAWPSYDAFAAARQDFAGSFGVWAQAADRRVGTVVVQQTDGGALYVVTISGRPAGARETGAIAVLVRQADASFSVEPFSPASAGVRFTTPSPSAPSMAPTTPLRVASPTSGGRLVLVVDRDREPVQMTPDGQGQWQYLPSGGWSHGAHVATVVAVAPDGQAMSSSVVFDAT